MLLNAEAVIRSEAKHSRAISRTEPGPGSQTLVDQQVSITPGRKGQELVLSSHRASDQVRQP